MGRPGRPTNRATLVEKEKDKSKEKVVVTKMTTKTPKREDLKNDSLIAGRARRTPKPNPKYMGDEMMALVKANANTPSRRSRSNSSSPPPTKKPKKNVSRDEDDFELRYEDDDSDDEDDFIVEIPPLKPEKNLSTSSGPKKTPPVVTKVQSTNKPVNIMMKRKLEIKLEAPKIETIRKALNSSSPTNLKPKKQLRSSGAGSANTSGNKTIEISNTSTEKRTLRKRKAEEEAEMKNLSSKLQTDSELDEEMDITEDDDEEESEEEEIQPRITRNRSASSLGRKTPLAVSTPLPKKPTPTPPTVVNSTKTAAKPPPLSKPATSTKTPVSATAKPTTATKTPVSTKPVPAAGTKSLERATTKEPAKVAPPKINTSAPTVTPSISKLQTDFEDDVPTFTIVNIHDIMKKAPELTLKKGLKGKTSTSSGPASSKNLKKLEISDSDSDVELADDDIIILRDDSPKQRKMTDQINDLVKSRRKAQHIILREDFDPKAKSPATEKKSTGMATSTPKVSPSFKPSATSTIAKAPVQPKTFTHNNNNLNKSGSPSASKPLQSKLFPQTL